MNCTGTVGFQLYLLFFQDLSDNPIVLFFGLIFLGLFFYYIFGRKSKPVDPEEKNVAHGSAEWATLDKVLKAGFNRDYGLWLGCGFRYPKHGHLLTVASSGEGKGASVIIPNLLSNPGDSSFFVTDPKGELACITARAQHEFGQSVIILDPWNEQEKVRAKHGIPASGFNPFDYIKQNMDELQDNCEQIAYFLVPDRPEAKDPFWSDRARSMIKSFLMHIVTGYEEADHDFWTLYRMVRNAGQDWKDMLLEMKDNDKLDGLISAAAGEYLGFDPDNDTLNSIKSSAQNATSIFESPQLRASLERSEFNPFDLTRGGHTVYVVIPERYIDTHATWLRMVIGLCLKACNAKPNKRVYYLLDEFAVMGKMRDIQRGFAFARGQNIVLWVFAQSLSQLKETYGEEGMNSFISNAAILQFFGVKDHYTREFISKYLGEGTTIKKEESFSSSTGQGGAGTSSSKSYSKIARPLLTAEEVGKEPNMIIIGEMIKFLLPKIPYFRYPPEPKKEGEKQEDKKFDLSKFKNNTRGLKEVDGADVDMTLAFAEMADPPPHIVH